MGIILRIITGVLWKHAALFCDFKSNIINRENSHFTKKRNSLQSNCLESASFQVIYFYFYFYFCNTLSVCQSLNCFTNEELTLCVWRAIHFHSSPNNPYITNGTFLQDFLKNIEEVLKRNVTLCSVMYVAGSNLQLHSNVLTWCIETAVTECQKS